MAISLIRNYIAKQIMKKGKGITSVIPDSSKVTFSANALEKRLIQHGVDLNSIKSEEQLKQILAYVKQAEDQAFTERFGHILKNNKFTKKGEVVDLTGKKIDTSKPILGGKNVPESEVQIKSKLEGLNKKTIERIKRRRLEAAQKAEREKMAKDPDYIPDIIDPDDYLADGGLAGMLGERTGYDTGKIVKGRDEEIFYPPYETNDPKEAIKEIIKRLINVEPAKVPLTDKLQLMFDLNRIKAGGSTDLFGGELNFGYNKDLNREGEGIGFEWKKQFADGGLAPLLGEPTYADGGRIGFKKGTKFNPKRRGFLKGIAALAALPIVGKYFKFAKPLAKTAKVADLTSVPIKNISGMPAWFKPLVNKVIKEGEEIGSGAERVIVHKTKLPNSKTDVYVTQELDTGHVGVEIGSGKHGFADGHLGQPVRLEYKASEVIEPTHIENIKRGSRFEKTGKPTKTKEEFWVEEAEFTGGHPENVKFEESTFNKFGEHGSDFSEVEKFATGKVKKVKPTKKKTQTEFESGKAEMEAESYEYEGPDDFASGGRVPLDSGGPININALIQLYMAEGMSEAEATAAANKPLPFHILTDKAEGGRVPFAGGAIVKGGKWFLKSLTDTREAIKNNKNYPPEQINLFLKQIDDQIKNIEAGGPIPDEVIQTIRKDPKFKSVWQNQKSADPDLREMEEVLLEYGTKHATGGRVSRSGGGIMQLLKTIFKKAPKKSYERVDLEKLLKGKDKIPVYSGSMKRQSNTWQSFIEDARKLGSTPEKIAKDKFKDQWFTPFRSYAESFTNPKDLASKMRTVDLTPKEIAIAKRYVDKVNKKDLLVSMRRKLGIKPYPKHTITTDENLVLIPKYKLKKLEKENRIMTDYLIKDKIKKKLGLAEGGLAGMLGE